jgi:hypothetical protein
MNYLAKCIELWKTRTSLTACRKVPSPGPYHLPRDLGVGPLILKDSNYPRTTKQSVLNFGKLGRA